LGAPRYQDLLALLALVEQQQDTIEDLEKRLGRVEATVGPTR
jgi:predicted transcriptional regulator